MTVPIYDRMDKNMPFNSPMYIFDTHINYVVVTNLYGVTFHKEFETADKAIEYYKEKRG